MLVHLGPTRGVLLLERCRRGLRLPRPQRQDVVVADLVESRQHGSGDKPPVPHHQLALEPEAVTQLLQHLKNLHLLRPVAVEQEGGQRLSIRGDQQRQQ